MAVLTTTELAELRNTVERHVSLINYDKTQINAAMQAIEDSFETSGDGILRGALNAALTPFVPIEQQRNFFIASWMKQKVRREGV